MVYVRKPDLMLVNQKDHKVALLDIAMPCDTRVEEITRENAENYHDSKMELMRLLKSNVKVEQIILGTLRVVLDALRRNLSNIGRKYQELELLEKKCVSNTENR